MSETIGRLLAMGNVAEVLYWLCHLPRLDTARFHGASTGALPAVLRSTRLPADELYGFAIADCPDDTVASARDGEQVEGQTVPKGSHASLSRRFISLRNRSHRCPAIKGIHWAFTDLLPLVGAKHEKARVVKDGNVITAGGVTSGIDFGLTVAAEIAGETTAQTIQLGIEYDPAPPFDSGHPDRAPAAIKSALLSDRYDEARSAFRAGIDKATRL